MRTLTVNSDEYRRCEFSRFQSVQDARKVHRRNWEEDVGSLGCIVLVSLSLKIRASGSCFARLVSEASHALHRSKSSQCHTCSVHPESAGRIRRRLYSHVVQFQPFQSDPGQYYTMHSSRRQVWHQNNCVADHTPCRHGNCILSDMNSIVQQIVCIADMSALLLTLQHVYILIHGIFIRTMITKQNVRCFTTTVLALTGRGSAVSPVVGTKSRCG